MQRKPARRPFSPFTDSIKPLLTLLAYLPVFRPVEADSDVSRTPPRYDANAPSSTTSFVHDYPVRCPDPIPASTQYAR